MADGPARHFPGLSDERRPLPPAAGRRRSWRRIALLALLIACSHGLLVGGALWREYDRTVAEAEADALNVIRLLAALADRSVEEIDHKLAFIGASVLRSGEVPTMPAPFTATAVVDGHGRRIAGSPDLASMASAAPAAETSLSVLPPYRDDARGEWLLPFRRTIREDGKPVGTVLGTVEARTFSRLFETVRLREVGSIGANLADGTLVARIPYEPEWIGTRFDRSQLFTDLLPKAPSGTGTLVFYRTDGLPRLVAYQTLAAVPMVIAITRPWSEILAPWRREVMRELLVWGVVAGAATALLLAVMVWMRRVQAAEEARLAAEHANRAKSDFLALMSHELRTPLNTILGFAEMIRDRVWDGGPDAESRYVAYAADIHAAGSHLMTLINDVLDLAKIEAGHMEIRPEPLDPADLVHACQRLGAGMARKAGVTVLPDVAPGLPPLHADPRAARQMLVNLLANACKFSPRGAEIRLSVERDPERPGGAVVRVADRGIGMTREEMVRALQPFGQIDNLMTRSHAGTGLGLPMVKGLIELHGGRMELDSAPGRGTTVTLRFPPARAEPVPPR